MAYAPQTNDDFWSKAGPGLLDFGLNLYSQNSAQREAEERLKRARGPLYDQGNAAAQAALNQAATTAGQATDFDPDKYAAERFAKQQALMKPVQDKNFADITRELYAKGQLGTGVYNPGLEGFTSSGMLMNPKLAAFYAAQEAQRSKDAAASMDAGQDYLDRLLKRAGLANQNASSAAQIAANAQRTGIEGEKLVPSKSTSNAQLIKGGMGILKDTGILGGIFKPGGMISTGADWLKDLFGGADNGSSWDYGGFDDVDWGGGYYDDYSGGDWGMDYSDWGYSDWGY